MKLYSIFLISTLIRKKCTNFNNKTILLTLEYVFFCQTLFKDYHILNFAKAHLGRKTRTVTFKLEIIFHLYNITFHWKLRSPLCSNFMFSPLPPHFRTLEKVHLCCDFLFTATDKRYLCKCTFGFFSLTNSIFVTC